MMEIVFMLQTNKIGSKCFYYYELDKEDEKEWRSLDDFAREEWAKELFMDSIFDHLGGWDWYEKESI